MSGAWAGAGMHGNWAQRGPHQSACVWPLCVAWASCKHGGVQAVRLVTWRLCALRVNVVVNKPFYTQPPRPLSPLPLVGAARTPPVGESLNFREKNVRAFAATP